MEWRFYTVISDLCSLTLLITKKGESLESQLFSSRMSLPPVQTDLPQWHALCEFASHLPIRPFYFILGPLAPARRVPAHSRLSLNGSHCSHTLLSRMVRWGHCRSFVEVVFHLLVPGDTGISLTSFPSKIMPYHVPCHSSPLPKSLHFFFCLAEMRWAILWKQTLFVLLLKSGPSPAPRRLLACLS